MLRTFLLFACLLGVFSATDSVAAPADAARFPEGRILAGNHRPVYKRYGHNGLFGRGGLFNGFRRQGMAHPSGGRVVKKHRGTL